MRSEIIAKELVAVARELTAKDKQIAFNMSRWGEGGSYTDVSMAWVMLDPTSWDLTLIVEDQKKENGRIKDRNVVQYDVGTMTSPELGKIQSILRKHQPINKTSPDGNPFSKDWTSGGKRGGPLTNVLREEMKKAQIPLQKMRGKIMQRLERMSPPELQNALSALS